MLVGGRVHLTTLDSLPLVYPSLAKYFWADWIIMGFPPFDLPIYSWVVVPSPPPPNKNGQKDYPPICMLEVMESMK